MIYTLLRSILLPRFIPHLSITGQEHIPTTGACILAPNHVDWLDGFYVSAAIQLVRRDSVKFLTASNNYWWTGVAIQIPLFRSSIVDRAVREFTRGAIVANFPEGQRNHTATLTEGKTGTVRMAALAAVPVIPVGIRCTPHDTFRQAWRELSNPEYQVAISFGQPLTFTRSAETITHEWLKAETHRLMSAISPLAGKATSAV